jgi:hypothetical protein
MRGNSQLDCANGFCLFPEGRLLKRSRNIQLLAKKDQTRLVDLQRAHEIVQR